VIAFLATSLVGGSPSPSIPLLRARAEHQLRDCGAKIAVVLDRFFPLVKKVQPQRHWSVSS